MKIARLIFFSFFFILLLFAFTTYIFFQQTEEVNENVEYVSRSSTIVRQSTRLQRNILNMVSGLRGYLLTGESYFLQTYDSAALENDSIFVELQALVPDGSVQKKEWLRIDSLYHQWVQEYMGPQRNIRAAVVARGRSGSAYEVETRARILSAEERGLNRELLQQIREFVNDEYRQREARKMVLENSVRHTRNLSISLTVLSIIAGFMVVAFLVRRISSRIRKMVTMANSIAAGSYGVHMTDHARDELSELSQSLNHMSQVLAGNISLLKRKNEELDQYAHVASHDLKAPLRGIDNVLSWIEEDHAQELTPKVNEYLQIIRGRVRRSENLIQGVLSYARVGKQGLSKEKVDVQALVEEIWENLMAPPGLRLETAAYLPLLFTERIPLLQVFSNLIGNAVKYHHRQEGIIKVSCTEHADHFEFSVGDDGPGIAKHYHAKIFQMFQTLQERDTFESTGVGLAIVKKILDERKETITLNSEPGSGSVFSFTWSK